jgi:hypothetical protein
MIAEESCRILGDLCADIPIIALGTERNLHNTSDRIIAVILRDKGQQGIMNVTIEARPTEGDEMDCLYA